MAFQTHDLCRFLYSISYDQIYFNIKENKFGQTCHSCTIAILQPIIQNSDVVCRCMIP